MDMRATFDEKQSALTKTLKTPLTDEQKQLMLLALEFGYVSALCSRTCDMNESWYAASTYTDQYNKIRDQLKNQLQPQPCP